MASYTPTASWLAALTPRRRFGRALDIGTGSGAQALLASRHTDQVIATDLNPRAIAFTALNAALNGIDNVEVRLGSLFEPVAGETFDLITCNAPYVVSPEDRWQYRDAAGFEADLLSQTVVTQAPEHLNDDGFACMLVSWVAESEHDPTRACRPGSTSPLRRVGDQPQRSRPARSRRRLERAPVGRRGGLRARARPLDGVLRRARRRLDQRGRSARAQAARATGT